MQRWTSRPSGWHNSNSSCWICWKKRTAKRLGKAIPRSRMRTSLHLCLVSQAWSLDYFLHACWVFSCHFVCLCSPVAPSTPGSSLSHASAIGLLPPPRTPTTPRTPATPRRASIAVLSPSSVKLTKNPLYAFSNKAGGGESKDDNMVEISSPALLSPILTRPMSSVGTPRSKSIVAASATGVSAPFFI